MTESLKPEPLKVAIAGLGTVGGGVVRLLHQQSDLIRRRCGRAIELVAVSALEPPPDLATELVGVPWFGDAVTMARDAAADVVVELIGGAHGVALRMCETALEHGRHVVTANKAMLAHHGTVLAERAESRGLSLGFEAAVAGGIPIIKALREGLAGNRILEIHGILNGTCNYILSRMRKEGLEFEAVLADAQRLGYAEADPTFDIDGIDAAHKLAILASVAFGGPVRLVPDNVEGIRHVTAIDIKYAEQLGYRIKLLGITRRSGALFDPCLVPIETPIAAVEDVFNAVIIVGDFVDRVVLVGRGAGANPTASAVVADLIDIAAGRHTQTFGVAVADLDPIEPAPLSARVGAYYVRLMVRDEVGVLASVAGALAAGGVSIAQFFQDRHDPGEKVPVVLTTHATDEASMRRALDLITGLGPVMEPPRLIRIEPF